MRKISDLKPYQKNPRQMSDKDHKLLQESLDEFGDLSGVIFNTRTGNLVGGHQRTNIFSRQSADIEITETFSAPTVSGTTALGFIKIADEKFAYREVDWETDKEERANILANKVSADWDFDILANQFDLDVLLASGFDEAELGFGIDSFDPLGEEETERLDEKTVKSCPHCGKDI